MSTTSFETFISSRASSSCFLISISCRFKSKYWNHAAEKLFGYTATETLHRNDYKLLEGGACPELSSAHTTVIELAFLRGSCAL